MLKKYLGLSLSFVLFSILIVQVVTVNAQEADQPITGPITDPLTSPIETPTDTPTPTLIDTTSTTPTPTDTPTNAMTPTPTDTATPTATPSETMTPTPTVTPSETTTPTPTTGVLGAQLGGLNLDGYCQSLNMPWDVVVNGSWYCGSGASPIDMVAACQWQYSTMDVIAKQEVSNNPDSWDCYASAASPTDTPIPTPSDTITPTDTPTETPSITPTPTDDTSGSGPTVTPSETVTPTPTDVEETVTPTPTVESSEGSHQTGHDRDSHHGGFHFSIPFFFRANISSFFQDKDTDHEKLQFTSHSCNTTQTNTHETYYHSPRR